MTYFKKFGELPPEDEGNELVHLTSGECDKVLKNISLLKDPVVVEFATILVESWKGEGIDLVSSILNLIGTGELKPEFEIPEEPERLAEWLDINLDDATVKRQIRSKLRAIAKDTSETYLTGNLSLNK